MLDLPPPTKAPTPPPGRYFLTGASGFIGSHFIRRLSDAGCEVIATLRNPKGNALPGVTGVACDIRDRDAVRRATEGKGITYGIHLAARVGDWGTQEEFDEVNESGARNVLEALIAAGAKQIVHTSSIATMGFDPGMAATEDAPYYGGSEHYSRSKVRGERVARGLAASGAPLVIIRPGDVYGPGSDSWVVRPVAMLRTRQMLLVDGGSGHFGHVYVDNVIDAMILALSNEAARGRTYIVTDTEQLTTFGDYFTRLAVAAGAPKPFISLPKPAALLLARGVEKAAEAFSFKPPITQAAIHFITKHGSYSIVRARNELGYVPRVDLDEGLSRIREAYQGG